MLLSDMNRHARDTFDYHLNIAQLLYGIHVELPAHADPYISNCHFKCVAIALEETYPFMFPRFKDDDPALYKAVISNFAMALQKERRAAA